MNFNNLNLLRTPYFQTLIIYNINYVSILLITYSYKGNYIQDSYDFRIRIRVTFESRTLKFKKRIVGTENVNENH